MISDVTILIIPESLYIEVQPHLSAHAIATFNQTWGTIRTKTASMENNLSGIHC